MAGKVWKISQRVTSRVRPWVCWQGNWSYVEVLLFCLCSPICSVFRVTLTELNIPGLEKKAEILASINQSNWRSAHLTFDSSLTCPGLAEKLTIIYFNPPLKLCWGQVNKRTLSYPSVWFFSNPAITNRHTWVLLRSVLCPFPLFPNVAH